MKFFSSLRIWLLDDVLWKIFSVLLALGIWLTVHKILVGAQANFQQPNISTYTYVSLPVLIVARAADVHNYKVRPEMVSVTVSGSPDDIAKLQADSIRASVDLTDIDAVKEAYKPVDIAMPPGITLMKVVPPQVSVVVPTLRR
jgi:YbbR domain-containing protein